MPNNKLVQTILFLLLICMIVVCFPFAAEAHVFLEQSTPAPESHWEEIEKQAESMNTDGDGWIQWLRVAELLLVLTLTGWVLFRMFLWSEEGDRLTGFRTDFIRIWQKRFFTVIALLLLIVGSGQVFQRAFQLTQASWFDPFLWEAVGTIFVSTLQANHMRMDTFWEALEERGLMQVTTGTETENHLYRGEDELEPGRWNVGVRVKHEGEDVDQYQDFSIEVKN